MSSTIEIQEVITIDPEIVSGVPVFTGTRVPVQILFDHLLSNQSIEVFLEDFPSVTRMQVNALLEYSSSYIHSPKGLQKSYENIV